MADFARVIRRSPSISFRTILTDIKTKKDSDEFVYNGSQMFHGMQGEGKTVSMYKYGMEVFDKFKKSVIVTNLHLLHMTPVNINDISMEDLANLGASGNYNWSQQYVYIEDFNDVMKGLKNARNGKFGVIFMIDEIHTYFHSHDSKGIPMWVQRVFSQQRKQFLVILGTVQDWNDLTKIIRTQAKNLVLCHKIGYFITHTVVDPRTMEMEYGEQFFPVKRKGFFFLSQEIRDGMDTYQVIDSGREAMGGGEMSGTVQRKKNGTIANRRNSIIPRKSEIRNK